MSADSAGSTLYVGVDGGGSRCRVRVRDGEGRLRSTIEGGTANVYLDFETAIGNIRDCVAQSVRFSRDETGPVSLRLGVGLAGVSAPRVGERVRAALGPLGHVEVTHDGDIACIGAHGGEDGGLIIAGTGSAAVIRVAGRSTSIGGRGFIMGDEGSGARIGLEALRRSLRAFDGLDSRTGLGDSLMAHFQNDPVQLIEWARTARSSDFGAFAPAVFSAARDGDLLGLSLVQAAAGAIAELADVLVRRGAPRLAFVGGLSAALLPHLPASTLTRLHEPMFDALEGALILAGCAYPAGRPSPASPGGG